MAYDVLTMCFLAILEWLSTGDPWSSVDDRGSQVASQVVTGQLHPSYIDHTLMHRSDIAQLLTNVQQTSVDYRSIIIPKGLRWTLDNP